MIENIEKLIQTNIINRKLENISYKSQLKEIVKELLISDCVGIITGFPVYGKNIGETDGPLGAVSIAYALYNLGKEVFLITDRYSLKLIKAEIDFLNIDIKAYDIEKFKDEFENRILKKEISHIISIERPGKAYDGKYYSMNGFDISDLVYDTDFIFEIAKKNNIKTIAIGDGGNELGFGNIKDYVEDKVDHGKKIAAKLFSDYILICGISNWGGYGIAKALSLKTGINIIYDEKVEANLLKIIVENGAVDGCTGENTETVDGSSKEEYLDVIRGIYYL